MLLCISFHELLYLQPLFFVPIIIGTFQEATKKSKLYMVASDLSEMENNTEKKSKKQLESSNHFEKNKKFKKLQYGNSKNLTKKSFTDKTKLSIPQYHSSGSSNSSLSDMGISFT